MGDLSTLTKAIKPFGACLSLLLIACMLLSACGPAGRPPQVATVETVTPSATWALPSATPEPPPSPTATPDFWPSFAPSRQAAPTAVPEPAPRLQVPDEVELWLLMGTSLETPFRGRTDAFHLLIFNERLARAAVVSIPGSLYVYLPGETMQRLSTAYALGGVELVNTALAYNFGIRANRYVLAHPQEFGWLVEDLGGLELSVLYPIRDACGGVPAGVHSFDAQKTLCYVSFISNDDEIDRVRRQQQVLQLLFNKLVHNGRLSMLPVLYASYKDSLETDLALPDLVRRIPLALKLGDPQRVAYYVLGWEFVSQWELPDDSQTKVLLPKRETIQAELRDALDYVMQPLPLAEQVLTLEAQATQAVFATQTAIALAPPTATPTVVITATAWASVTPPWHTPTSGPGATPLPSQTPTVTSGPYPAATPIPTAILPYP